MSDGKKLVCAAGSVNGPYNNGDEILDESEVCDDWEESFSVFMSRI